MSGELDEIGYQLKELNKTISELSEKFDMLEELGDIRRSIDALLAIQNKYMTIQKDIVKGDGSG